MAGDERADGAIGAFLRALHQRLASHNEGEVATYIPELGKADPKLFGLAIATTDGKVYVAGDAEAAFTIQSVSKPFMYGWALETRGRAAVMKHVGVEPTGAAFNATVFDEDNNRPSNPMVNAGAIAVSALAPGETYELRRHAMRALFSRYAGREVDIDESVFRSERETGDRNRAIAALMRQAEMLDGDTDAILDLYFSQCSVLTTCRDLAVMAAALANDGEHPMTGAQVLDRACVPDVLSVMHSCGMYNYAGQWSYEVGVPAKSGVSGAIIGVIPGQMGLAAYAPPLDRFGNSVRAIAAFKEIAEQFGLHVFRTPTRSIEVIRRELSGRDVRSKRRRSLAEREVLTEKGGRIRILEVQGALYFAAAEKLLRRMGEAAAECDFLILDFRRVQSADAAAVRLIDMALTAPRAGCVRLAAEIAPGGALEALRAKLESASPCSQFADPDAALEWCENALIQAAGEKAHAPLNFSLAHIDLFRGLDRQDLRALEAIARPFAFEAGQTIFREGDPAQLFFVIAQGLASIRLMLGGGPSWVRVASFGPGASFGEMALLDGGARSADVVAEEKLICYGFSVDELKTLQGDHILNTILLNLSADMAERLRAANAEIRALKH